jgi:ElaB/YqjD/DUF883 family membrane-anchored ribosome-binding protein
MDEKNPQSSYGGMGTERPGPVTRIKESISEKVTDVKAKVSDFGRDAANKLEGTRETAASALDSTASSLQAGTNRLSSAARTAADSLQSTANYVRDTNLQGMMEDLRGVVKRYPGQSLAAAAILGFLVARGFRSSSSD